MFKLNNIKSFLYSVKNVLILNLLILFWNIKNKKVILFYHPKDKLRDTSNYHISSLLKFHTSKNIKTLILNNSQKNLFSNNYLIQFFLRYIYGVDLFLCNYVCDYFPNNCNRAYIHHDIYDTPLTQTKNEYKLFKRFEKYDYILVPSKKSKNTFSKLNANYKNKKIKIFIVGYYKLDYLKKRVVQKKNKKKPQNILIAPTDYNSFPKMSLIKKSESLIVEILKKTNLRITFRPHPSNYNEKKIIFLKNKFYKNKRVIFDESKNYFDTYINSKLMISDLSGTAYTYSFLTNKPVVFFSNYEKDLYKLKYNNLNFFKDRNKIGFVVKDIKNLINILKKNSIYKIKSKTILKKLTVNFDIGSSKKNFDQFIKEVL